MLEIHGNVLYMRCSNQSCEKAPYFYKGPHSAPLKPEDVTPKCKTCASPMKPHCMFFDETYSEQWYRSETVKGYLEKTDCLIVVGTALQTSLAKFIVNSCINKGNVPVIEVNLESCIPKGYRILIQEPSEKSLPALFKEFNKQFNK